MTSSVKTRKPSGWLFMLIRLLSAVCCFLLPVPVVLFCEDVSMDTCSEWTILPIAVLFLVCGFFGLFVSFLANKLIADTTVSNALRYACTALAVSAALWTQMLYLEIYFPYNLFLSVMVPLLCGGVYVFGVLIYDMTYSEILSRKIIIAYLVCVLSAFFVLRVLGRTMPGMTVIVVCFLLLMFSYLLASNQGNIDLMMERRSHSMSSLPPRIRYYSLFLLLLVFVGIILLMVFRGAIADAFRTVLGWIQWLLRQIKVENPPVPPEWKPTPTPTAEADPLHGSGRPHPLLWLAVGALFAAIILLYGRDFFRAMWEKIRASWGKFMTWLGRGPKKRVKMPESEYYYDTEASVKKDDVLPVEAVKPNVQFKRWKKRVRTAEKMADGEEKFRAGYGLLIEGLQLKKYPIVESDTPRELTEKATYYSDSLGEVPTATECYEIVRYAKDGGAATTEKTAALFRLLHKVEGMHDMVMPTYGRLD